MTLGKVFLTDLEVSEARRGWDGWAKCVRVFGFVSDGRRRLRSDSSHSAPTTIGASEGDGCKQRGLPLLLSMQ